MSAISVKSLFERLQELAAGREVHIVSLTCNSINYYIIQDYETVHNSKTVYRRGNTFEDITDVLFVDTTGRKHLSQEVNPQYKSVRQYIEGHGYRKHADDGEVVFVYGSTSGLPQIFSIHNTVMGPGVGGVREFDYRAEYMDYYLDAMLIDCLRLAEAMTCKGAINNSRSGGGKAARYNAWYTSKQKNSDKDVKRTRTAANHELGAALNVVNSLRLERGVNAYYTAEDVGISCHDLDEMYSVTPYVTCKSELLGGTGNPSPYTAIGVVSCLIEGAKRVFPGEENPISGKTVLLEGLGNCGREVLKHLVRHKAEVVATDIHQSAIDRAKIELGDYSASVKFVFYPKEQREKDPYIFIKKNRGDIYSPCALGATINRQTIPFLSRNGIKLVAGSANNQIAEQIDGEALHQKGILCLPDYVVNGAGVISARYELPDMIYTIDEMVDIARKRGEVVAGVLDYSIRNNINPSKSASILVRQILSEAERKISMQNK